MTLLNETDVLAGYLEKEVRTCVIVMISFIICLVSNQCSLGPFDGEHRQAACVRRTRILSADVPMSCVQDCFFYSLVFDPVQKTLLADQGEIRVGSKYQAEIPDMLAEG